MPRSNRQPDLWEKLDEYWDTLQATQLTDASIRDYYMFAEQFVRWIEGNFEPGAHVK